MISPAVKAELRVKYNNQCVKCHAKTDLSVDHIVPRWLGGGDEIGNLQILCKTCNLKKGNTPPLWLRLKHLWGGFFYRHLNDLKSAGYHQYEQIRKDQQSIRDTQSSTFAQLRNEVKDFGGRLKVLEFENKQLKTDNLKLEIKLKAMEEYQGIKWVEQVITLNRYMRKEDDNSPPEIDAIITQT